MSDPDNIKTLESYDSSVLRYQESVEAPQDPALTPNWQWVDAALAYLPVQARIFEIGSGTGRDAEYIEKKGFLVERSDASKGFLDLLRAEGHKAREFNILCDELPQHLDLIYANAVFPHFRPSQLEDILRRCRNALRPKGILAFSCKLGDGEVWTDEKLGKPRFFYLWKAEELQNMVESQGFSVLWSLREIPGQFDHRWIFLIVQPCSSSLER